MMVYVYHYSHIFVDSVWEYILARSINLTKNYLVGIGYKTVPWLFASYMGPYFHFNVFIIQVSVIFFWTF